MSRTVIDIKDELIEKAKGLTGMTKKVDVVNYALKKLVSEKENEKKKKAFLSLAGSISEKEAEIMLEEVKKARRLWRK